MSIPHQRYQNKKKKELLLFLGVIIALSIAWVAGTFRTRATLSPFLGAAFPQAGFFEPGEENVFIAWRDKNKKELVGYAALGEAHGYGGRIKVLIAIDPQGVITRAVVVEHRETASFFLRVKNRGLIDSLVGKSVGDPLRAGEDIDVISGATMTSRALIDSVRGAAREVAGSYLGLNLPPEPRSAINFGGAEVALLVLLLVGLVGRSRLVPPRPWRKVLRWGSLLTGMVVLGFIFNRPLTLAHINKVILGYWPAWWSNPYFYLLVLGVLGLFFLTEKNPYCEWFCPFGAVQETLRVVGGGSKRLPSLCHRLLRWGQRLAVLVIVCLALYYRNPSTASYEVFGALFHLVGSNFHFILLGVVLVASLFLHRPWCNYLCPVRPATEFIRLARRKANAGLRLLFGKRAKK
ncbi:FMN-binding protein [Candidatus Aminicenantes bacterium AC-334-K16]|jgi:uncharacterized protein with FMN-binding domain|nr:FMN-binding protein [Candidatus Aminicenantes bacterium AC-334-K16]